jgi:UDP-galactopyranose mutase
MNPTPVDPQDGPEFGAVSLPVSDNFDLVVFSHLRWNFVFQRPQHLLSRCARQRRVFYIEEPIFSPEPEHLQLEQPAGQLWVVTPYLVEGMPAEEVDTALTRLTDALIEQYQINEFVAWYYTPMALKFSRHLSPMLTVYDCMDELSAFKFAPPELHELERELVQRAGLMFTGGQTLFEAKRALHNNIHAFPSSIDRQHYAKARQSQDDPADQAGIPHPRLGFFGVIDERMDLDLLAAIADARPEWHLVMVGPFAKVNPADLPQRANIHYLGSKSYDELPTYLAGWDVALLPFAINESTRYISPTKTPEYLAGGKPVVSTPIRDVVMPYGEQGLVRIAAGVDEFILAVEQSLEQARNPQGWLARVDRFLAQNSWDQTWRHMDSLILQELQAFQALQPRLVVPVTGQKDDVLPASKRPESA